MRFRYVIVCFIVLVACSKTIPPNFESIQESMPDDIPRLMHMHGFDSVHAVLEYSEMGSNEIGALMDCYYRNNDDIIHYALGYFNLDSPHPIFTFNNQHQLQFYKSWVKYAYTYNINQNEILQISTSKHNEIERDTSFFIFKDGQVIESEIHNLGTVVYTYDEKNLLSEKKAFLYIGALSAISDTVLTTHYVYSKDKTLHSVVKSYGNNKNITLFNELGLPTKTHYTHLPNDTVATLGYTYFK